MLTLLRRRNFALLWFAGLLSLVGDRALITALPFYVYQRTGSTLASGAMFFALYLPTLLLGSVAGVFVDRWNRKRLMVVTNLLQAAIILLLLVPLPAEWLWLIYLVFFAEIALSMFFEPAENALLPHLVPESDLIAANGLNELNNNLARLVGPPLGGMLLTLLGLHSVVLLDGVSFLVSALLIAGITTSATPAPAPGDPPPAPGKRICPFFVQRLFFLQFAKSSLICEWVRSWFVSIIPDMPIERFFIPAEPKWDFCACGNNFAELRRDFRSGVFQVNGQDFGARFFAYPDCIRKSAA